MRPFRTFLLVSTALCALPAAAQDAVELDTITISASSTPLPVSRTGATVSVVTADDLTGGSLSLAEQLAREPGISFTRNGGMGTATTLRLRGLNGSYIGVQFDGIDITDPAATQAQFDFSNAPSANLSRVEVLRGSQSALYGANAVAGVIDMQSWRPEKDGTSGVVNLEGGSDATWTGTASAGIKGARGEFALSASRTITDGISAYADGTEDDAWRSSDLSFYGAYEVAPGFRIGANGLWRKSYTEFDTQTADEDNSQDTTLRGGRIFAQFGTGAVSHELSYDHTQTERDYDYPSTAYTYNAATSSFDGKRDRYRYSGTWQGTDLVSLSWGAEHAKESYATSYDYVYVPAWSSASEGSARSNAVFGELLYAPTEDVDLSFALRHDDPDDFSSKTTGRFAVVWRPAEDWILRGVASTGYRAPSLYERYSEYGSTGLTPETSKSYELGVERLFEGGSVQATLFKTDIDDLIQYTGYSCTAGYYCYEQTPGTATTQGIEIAARATIATGIQVFANYTYTDAKNDNDGTKTRLARVPRHDLAVGVEAVVAPQWHVKAALRHVSDYLDADIGSYPATYSGMPDYTLVNASVAYDVTEATQAYLRIENLFDEDYQTVRNYGQPGRQVFLGVRTTF